MASSIQNLLDQILNAVYGEEVRGAIHDSIEQCYSDVSTAKTNADTAVSNANTAIANANAAAGNATTAATSATSAAAAATEATGTVNDAIAAATTAATNADSKAALANAAATNADSKATLANTAASNANTAASSAQAIIARWNGTDGATGLLATINSAISDASDAADAANDAAEGASSSAEAADTAASEAQDIVTAWNGSGSTPGISADIQTAIGNIQTATSSAQAIIARWNGTDGETGLYDTITGAIEDAETATQDVNTVIENAETATEEAIDARNAALEAELEALSAASDARIAKKACADTVIEANTAIGAANTARDNANSAAGLITNLELVSQPVGAETPSSAIVELIDTGTTPYYRITMLLSKGIKGDSLIIKGEAFALVEDLMAAHPAASTPVGDMYNVGTAPPYNVYRNTGSYWENQGPIGFSIDNLANTDIDSIWEGSYNPGSSSKYIDDSGLLYLVVQKVVSALAGKVNVDGNKVLSTNDFTDAYALLLADETTSGSLKKMISDLDNLKVDKDGNKVLSTYDYTQTDYNLVRTIIDKVNKSDVDSVLNINSNNPIRNSTVATAINTLTADTSKVTAMAPAYDDSITYSVGAYRTYNRQLYRCTTQIINAEDFTPSHWTSVSAGSEITSVKSSISSAESSITSLGGRVTTAEGNITTLQSGLGTASSSITALQTDLGTAISNFAAAYSTTKIYEVGEYCIYNNILYRCKNAYAASQQTFPGSEYWDAVTTATEFNRVITSTSTALANKDIVVTISNVSSLPQTVNDSRITANHVLSRSELSDPSAQRGDWTVTTAAGSVTVSGTISGTTNITLLLTSATAIS